MTDGIKSNENDLSFFNWHWINSLTIGNTNQPLAVDLIIPSINAVTIPCMFHVWALKRHKAHRKQQK